MHALVVYESMFGNTQAIALAIGEGLRRRLDADAVEVVEVGAAPTMLPPGLELLVVGGPTHAHGMTNPKTRTDAAGRAQGRLVSRGNGVREWLEALAHARAGASAAAFDTRIKGPGLLWGSAARGIDKRLRALGFRMAASPQDFLVEGPTGPMFDRLPDGELERARAWGEGLGATVSRAVASTSRV